MAGACLTTRDSAYKLPHTQQFRFNLLNPCEGYKTHLITIKYSVFGADSGVRK